MTVKLSFTSLALLAALPTVGLASDDFGAPAPVSSALAVARQGRHRGWDSTPNSDSDPFSVYNRQRIPFFVTLGAYFPAADVPVIRHGTLSSESGQVGSDVALGFRFPFTGGEARAVIRGSAFGFGSDDFGFGSSQTASIAEFDLDLLGRIKGFYAGVGAAFMNATLSSDFYSVSDNSTQTALAVTAGYDITPRWFVEAREHFTGLPVYDGSSVSVGYRF